MSSDATRSPPYYIVGLPDAPGEATEARMKFERLSSEITKVFPLVREIRAVVKSKKASKDHARYEVSVEIYTGKERHVFTEVGYNLPSVFETLGPKMKRLLYSRQSKVTGMHGSSRRKLYE